MADARRDRLAALEREVSALRKFQTMVESAFDTVWVLDRNGRVLYQSPSYGLQGAAPLDKPVGEANVFDLVHPDDVPRARETLRRVFDGAPRDTAFVHVRHRGEHGAWLESDAVIQNFVADPVIGGILMTGRPAGTRNPLHLALHDSEQRFRSLFETTSLAVTIRDVRTQRFIDCNAAALRLFAAKSREDFLATKPDQLAPTVQPDGKPSSVFLQSAVATALRDGRFRGEWTARRLNGETFPAYVHISRIDLDDGPIFQTLIEDMSDAKRNEAMLARAKEEAERANRLKSSFLATMSHELRTPLTGVIGMVDLLATTHLDERQRRYTETARASARVLMSVINDILDFSKIEAGKLELSRVPFSVHDVIDDVGSVLALSAEQKNLDLVCSIDDLDGRFIGDPDRLRQVVTNLVHNAIKFTSRGEVFIHAYAVSGDDEAVLVRIDVRDTGVGIARSDIERVFTPFTQLDTGVGRHGSSGLGLTICRELVERMGGTIGVESSPGVGTTFFFTLPLTRVDPPPVVERASFQARVLVVAPQPRTREVLIHHLAKLRVVVDTAQDAGTARQRLLTMPGERNVVVIVDAPHMSLDARAVAEHLRADARLSSTQIVIVDSVGRPLDEHERSRLGVVASCSKPVWSRRLEGAVYAALADGAAVVPSSRNETAARNAARILVVDDNGINTDVACEVLAAAGYRHLVARDGIEAVEMFEREHCDLVLMDCQLPGIDGFEATRRMRAVERRRNRARTPIVALTASVTAEELDACLRAGMDGHVAKPVDAQRLIETVERHLATSPAADSRPTNLARGLERLRGDRRLLDKLVRKFVEVAPDARDALRVAVSKRDTAATRFACHRLRGQASTFDANPLVAALTKLEEHAQASDWARAQGGLEVVEVELARALTHLLAPANV